MLTDVLIQKIFREDVHFHFSKSGGHGGQNVNKRKTKAELYFNIDNCHYLSEEQKNNLKKIGGNFVHHHSSVLILTCQEQRYQHANKTKVSHHFVQLLHQACDTPIERIPTQAPSYLDHQKKHKKIHHGDKKYHRRSIDSYQE
jgi:protein subunit release factor B